MDKFTEVGLVEKSLKRCLAKEGFLAQFYFELCNFVPTSYDYLEGPVLDEYKNNLGAILKFLMDFGKGQKKSVTIQKNLQMGLTVDTVQYWEQALLSAVSTNDEELDQETAGAWRALTKNGLEFLLSKNKLKKAA